MPERITHDVLAEIVGIAADAIICMDDFQRITFFNSGAEQIFGWTAQEVIGERIEILMPERYRSSHSRQVADFGRSKVTARRMGERREIAGVRKTGEEFPAEAAISQVHLGDSTIYAVVLRDVSVRKRFEQRQEFLARAGERLASAFGSGELLESVVDLAVPTLADGCILESRVEDGYRAGGCNHSDPEIRRLLQAVCDAGLRRPPPNNPLSEILRTQAPVLLQSDAGERIAEASTNKQYIAAMRAMKPAAAVYLPLISRGQLIGVLSLFRKSRGFDGDDLAFAEDLGRLAALALDNSRLLEAVRSSLHARDEMVGVVSHDLRNPVAAIKMLSRSLLANSDVKADEAQVAENLSLIVDAAEQMDSLIRDLLDVNRLDAGMLVFDPDFVEVASILSDALRTLRPLVSDKRIALDVQIEAGLPKVFADPERIQQAISNLVGNALKFTPANGKIVIESRRDDDEVVISVRDNGSGISPTDLTKVFDRYWQSTRTNRQGAGLGLAITKGIVESHGGRIWLESEPGKGTVVHFTLPTSADGAAVKSPHRIPDPARPETNIRP